MDSKPNLKATRIFYDIAPRRTMLNGERKMYNKRLSGKVIASIKHGLPDISHVKKQWTVSLDSKIGKLRPFLTADEKREAGY